jgi:hypothetical protein
MVNFAHFHQFINTKNDLGLTYQKSISRSIISVNMSISDTYKLLMLQLFCELGGVYDFKLFVQVKINHK